MRFLRASVFMRVGRFHARVSTRKRIIIFWSFLFTPTNNHGTRRERIWIFFFITFFIVCIIQERPLFFPPTLPPRKKTVFVKPVQFPPPFSPPKKRILCLGCKICKDFFFLFFLGKRNVRFRGAVCVVHKTRREREKDTKKNVSRVCKK